MAKYLRELGYVGFGVSNMSNWIHFSNDVLGVEVVSGHVSGTNLLRLDDRAYRFILVEDGTDDVAFVGWDAGDEATLNAYADYLGSIGVSFSWGSPEDIKIRGVEKMLHFADPDHVRHEAFVGLSYADTKFVSPKIAGGYVTDVGGLGHVVFGSKHFDEAVQFATKVLGAATSDTIRQEIMPGRVLTATFFHVNERHHSIAYADQTGPKKMHHFMLEVGGVADVGKTRDRHIKFGLPIAQDIGQHPNDQMISYYGVVPSGFLLEFGCGGIKVDTETWQVGSYDHLSDWGHRPLAPQAQ